MKGAHHSSAGQFKEVGSCLIGLEQLPLTVGSKARNGTADADPRQEGVSEREGKRDRNDSRLSFSGEFACVSAMTPAHAPLRLVAVLQEAHGLKAADLNGYSDPYVVISLLDSLGKPLGENVARSRVILKNLNPVWQECLSLPIHDLHGELLVQVFDSDWGGALNSDDLLAQYNIPLESLDAQALPFFLGTVPAHGVRNARGKDRPQTPPRQLGHKRGRVKLLNERYEPRLNKIKGRIVEPLPDAPMLLPEEAAALKSRVRLPSADPAPDAGANSVRKVQRGRGASSTAAAELKRMFGLEGINDHDHHHGQDHHDHNLHYGGEAGDDGAEGSELIGMRELEVVIVRGEHFPKMDTFGSCDGYVICEYGTQHHQTSVQSDTLDPVWEEVYTFRIPRPPKKASSALERAPPLLPPSRHLKLKVKDHDTLGKHRAVGEGLISSTTLAQIAKSVSGCFEELQVPLIKRRQNQKAAKGEGTPGNSRMVEVVGHDGEPAFVTIRLRVRPVLPYPESCLRQYHLDTADGSHRGIGGAGILRMGLILQPGMPRKQALPPSQCISERNWNPKTGTEDVDDIDAFKTASLRMTVSAPKIASLERERDATASPMSRTISPTMSRTISPTLSRTGSAGDASGKISPYGRSQAAEEEASMLPLGLIQVRIIAGRNLPLSRFQADGKLQNNVRTSLVVTSNGEERSGSGKGTNAGMFYQTSSEPAALGPVWMQSGSLCTNLASSGLDLELWANCASPGSDFVMAKASVDIGSLALKGEKKELFGWFPLQAQGSTGRIGGHEQHLRVRIIQARDLMCARHGDAHPYAIVTVVTNDWEGKPGVTRQTTLHAHHHTKGTDPVFDAHAVFEDIPTLQKHLFLSEEPKIPKAGARHDDTEDRGWDGCSSGRNLGGEGFLLVQLFDAATTFRSAHFLGQAIVPLSLGAGAASGEPRWYRLHGRGRSADKLKPRKRPHVGDESLGAVELCIELVDRGWLAPHLLMGLSALHETRACYRQATREEMEEAALRGERLLSVTVVAANGLPVADAGGEMPPFLCHPCETQRSQPDPSQWARDRDAPLAPW